MPLTEVLAHEQIGDNLFRLQFVAPVDLREHGYRPGQFLHIRVTDSFDFVLRRPISLCLADVDKNSITVVYRAQGEGTTRISKKRVGELIDVLGPLGNGYPLDEGGKALLVGGGIGVPPLLELARQLQGRGVSVEAVLGFQTASQVILLDDFAPYANVHVVTDDGSYGAKGLVTELLRAPLLSGVTKYYACGPTPMLAAVRRVMSENGITGYLSLEERMGCGTGICAGCVHKIKRGDEIKNLKTCKDGPVFTAEEVVFDD